MLNSIRLALTLAVSAAFCAAPMLAGTVKFPKKEPLMSFELPDDWRTEWDKGIFTAKPPGDDEFALTLVKMDGVKDEETAKKALPLIAKQACEATGAQGVKAGEVEEQKGVGKKGDLKMFASEAKGTDASGNVFVVTAYSIEADDEFVAFVTVATAAKDKKYLSALKKIAASIEERH